MSATLSPTRGTLVRISDRRAEELQTGVQPATEKGVIVCTKLCVLQLLSDYDCAKVKK
jgi:hypothetical protein